MTTNLTWEDLNNSIAQSVKLAEGNKEFLSKAEKLVRMFEDEALKLGMNRTEVIATCGMVIFRLTEIVLKEESDAIH